jgi:hypothetical protein
LPETTTNYENGCHVHRSETKQKNQSLRNEGKNIKRKNAMSQNNSQLAVETRSVSLLFDPQFDSAPLSRAKRFPAQLEEHTWKANLT